jgi:small-conductance mechanosensitive channel
MNPLDNVFLGNPLSDWLLAAATASALAVALILARRYLAGRWAAYAHTTESWIDDAVAEAAVGTRGLFLVVVGLYAGTHWLELPSRAERVVTSAAMIALLVQTALWINRGAAAWLGLYLHDRQKRDASGATTVAVLGYVARVAVWALAVLLILDNLGFNITALVASLGIGGIAVALALQNILGDLFASLSIALDKPFVIDDFIVVDDVLGTVEYIGLKTTRLRSLSGEQIVFSNADLLKSRIRNYKRMDERRALFNFGVTYDTATDKLARLPAIVRDCIEAQAKTRFDRAHFKEFGDSSLVFEAVYFVLDPDYNRYMDAQQAINLALLERLRAEGIEFAFPTRTLHVHDPRTPGSTPA